MTLEERKVFWDTLCSFDGSNPKREMEQLKATIRYPKYLFRYRPVNDRNLDALKNNRLYFSSANYYDDPFDTFLHIDIDRVEKELCNGFQNPTVLSHLADRAKAFADKYDGFFPEDFVQMITNPQGIQKMFFGGVGANFLDYLLTIRNKVREDTWSVCFSENGVNETLWLKYADQHKGFALVYDLENDQNLLCGKQEKCKTCRFQERLPSLYPLFYSDTPYDATDFAKTVLLHSAMKDSNIPDLPEILSQIGPAYWERERTTLIKKECHHYDEEWRMIFWEQMDPPIVLEWIPDGVILGLRIGKNEREQVISCAKQAGIKHIYKSYINRNNLLDMREIT